MKRVFAALDALLFGPGEPFTPGPRWLDVGLALLAAIPLCALLGLAVLLRP
jgi:hypothetical protein